MAYLYFLDVLWKGHDKDTGGNDWTWYKSDGSTTASWTRYFDEYYLTTYVSSSEGQIIKLSTTDYNYKYIVICTREDRNITISDGSNTFNTEKRKFHWYYFHYSLGETINIRSLDFGNTPNSVYFVALSDSRYRCNLTGMAINKTFKGLGLSSENITLNLIFDDRKPWQYWVDNFMMIEKTNGCFVPFVVKNISAMRTTYGYEITISGEVL